MMTRDHRCGGKREEPAGRSGRRVRLVSLLLCLSILSGLLPAPASAEESRVMLSGLAGFDRIVLHYADSEGGRGGSGPGEGAA